MAKDNTIGDNIRKLRDSAGYSQQGIAGFLKVDQSLISKIEKGERGLSSDMLDKLASLFGVAASAIVDDTASARPLSCAFRRGDLSPCDMDAISAVNKIALNSEFLIGLLKRGGI